MNKSILLALALIASPLFASEPAAGSGSSRVTEEPSPKCTRCGEGTFGTSVQWVGSVPEAARQAQKEQKLVFVLHVSGLFENAGYT